ncbi:6-phosphogluconolactonase [Pseudarcicella hirudinis]|uniref:6-phosphogluconolactonase n=1 Tax=Pseudarcicella hirudinis TaxID=1079859 RepID=UPI0035E91B4A
MKINVFKSADEVLSGLAEYFVETANQSIKGKGKFSVALSGGSSPKKLYELLASDAFKNRVDWNHVYFFFGDERNVPHTHADSNYLMAKTALFAPLNIQESHVFPVDTALSPEAAAEKYTQEILAFFGSEDLRFDLVLLGLGDNSHTASLFPYTPVLHDKRLR